MHNINSLLEKIKQHNEAYRRGNPTISDSEYDKLVEQLKELDPTNEWFTTIEPAPISPSRKCKLPIPMKSLNKVKSLSELQQWAKNLGLPKSTQLVIMPKYDGVSWLHDEINDITYSRGGAENEGQDCSAHYAEGIFGFRFYDEYYAEESATTFNYTFGELVFSRYVWENYYENKISDNGLKYKSPRNTVAGIINRDVPSEILKHIDFIRYGVDDESLAQFSKFSELLIEIDTKYMQAEQAGTTMPLIAKARLADLSEDILHSFFIDWLKYYYIDGLVIYIDDLYLWEKIGRQQTTGNPLYAVAYKHPDFTESFETTVKGIDWRVSKAGALKPIVKIDAVDTGDCTMENPTGYNARWCLKSNYGVGARILVTRSGGVIPKILKTLKPVACSLPSECPVCGSPTKLDEKGVDLYCTNSECDGIKLAKIIHFFNTVGIENMGEETFIKLFNGGHTSIKDILNISWDDLMKLEGFGESTANNILSQMRKILQGVDLATLIHASDCFKGIGKIKAQKIIDEMDDLELCSFCQGWYIRRPDVNPNLESFKKMPITSQNWMLGYFPFMQFLEDTGVPYILPKKQSPKGDKCTGMVVCFSGVRDPELEEQIKLNGGTIASSVTKKTTHLVVKDASDYSTKITKAMNLGTPICTLQEFKKLL